MCWAPRSTPKESMHQVLDQRDRVEGLKNLERLRVLRDSLKSLKIVFKSTQRFCNKKLDAFKQRDSGTSLKDPDKRTLRRFSHWLTTFW
jgi:ribosome assembly protein YihI (activator of Der GTPase)